MDGPGYLPPTRHLVVVENARGVGISKTPRGNSGRLGDDQPCRCPLPVVFGIEVGRHISRARPATGERRHENARWRQNLAELKRVKQRWNNGPPSGFWAMVQVRSPSARMIRQDPRRIPYQTAV